MRIISIRPTALAFRDTRVGDLLDAGFEDLLRGKLAQTFRESGKNVLAGNYTISGIKA